MMKRPRRGLKLKKANKEIKENSQSKIFKIFKYIFTKLYIDITEWIVDSQKLQKILKIVSPDLNYTKVKFKNEVYSLGDCLMIRDVNDGFLIGKLVKIIQTGGFKKYPYWPTVQIQW
jgi:disulfide oxidoreductase YuzD